MRISFASAAALAAVLTCAFPATTAAQTFESVGTRAQGMGGAFVAVADDANANWWNPAGLATGALLSMAVERSALTDPPDVPRSGPALRTGTSGIAFAFPSLGLSYYRLRISDIRPSVSPTEAGNPDREDQGATGVVRRSMAVSEFSAIVGQSVGDHLVVASRLKLIRAGRIAIADGAAVGEDALDRAADADVTRETSGGFDLGAMVSFSHGRIGMNVKNVNEPEFGDEEGFKLRRQARVGAAFFAVGSPGTELEFAL